MNRRYSMRESFRRAWRAWIWAASLALAGCGQNPGSAPAPSGRIASAPAKSRVKSAATNQTESIPKAVFVDDPKEGRDPFFPNSSRRGAAQGENAVSLTSLVQQLRLRAIFQSQPPRAWINNQSFEPGEQENLQLPDGQTITLRCVAIAGKSVEVEISGIPGRHTLKLEGVR